MSRRLFRFQQFSMTDEHCGMRIGTDAVLLGAWAAAGSGVRHIADIGTGCGIIALMLAQRAPQADVDAVECEPGACADARDNFEASPWSERLRLHQCSFAEAGWRRPFDLVVSNPPFFTETLQSPSLRRAGARHAGSLCFRTLAEACADVLADDGRLAVVLPSAQDADTLLCAELNRLYALRHCVVRNRAADEPVRSLWEFGRKPAACMEEELTIRADDNSFSQQYCGLTADFHIFLKQ